MRGPAPASCFTAVRKLFLICCVLSLLFAAAKAQSQELDYGLGYVYGTPAAPRLELPRLNGANLSLSDLSGKVVVVNFWATWCPPCIAELPILSALQAHYGVDDLIVLGVNLGEEAPVIKEFVDAFEPAITFPILLPPTPGDLDGWKIDVLPQSYIINKKGQIEFNALGPKNFVHPEILKRIQALVDRED